MPAEQRWAERRRSTALILLALFIVATALVLQPEGPSGAWNRVELVARAAVTRPCRQEPCERDQAVLASGYVQPVSGGSNERAIRNVVSQALTNAGGQRLNSAVGDAVRTHLLARNRPMPSLRESAKMASVVDAASAEQEENLMMSNLADVNPDRVLVKMFLESNCPSCRQFTRTCMANIMNADGISEIMDFEYISFGYGTIDEAVPDVRNRTKTDEVQLDSVDELKPVLHTIEDISMRGTSESMKPAITVACPHGSDECISDMYQACVQDVSPTQKEAFAVFLCMEDKFCGAASGTRGEQRNSSCGADPGETAHACLMDVAPHLAELVLACIKGDRKRELLVMNDIATIDARPQFLPWLTVDGRALGMSEQFLLGKHICNAYVAKTGELSGLCSGTPFAALRRSATAHACPRTGVAPHTLWGYHQLLPP